MTTPEQTAARLLDLQVAWAIGEVTGDRLAEVLRRDVDELWALASGHTVADVLDVDAVKATARQIADIAGGSEVVTTMVGEVATTVHGLPTATDHCPADLVEREHVEQLVAAVLSMHQLHDRVLDRLTESPLVGTVASKFVTRIVADFVQQNRERAEKVPGMSSLLSLGTGAVNRVRTVTDRHVDALLGDAAGKGAQYAIRRTNNAIRELIRDSPLQGAAMEIWDLHADEPLSELRKYLTAQDARQLAVLVHQLVADTAGSAYLGEVLDACVEVFFDRYGGHTVAALLAEAGIERDDVADALVRHAPPVVDALHARGELETLIRSRLEPFFTSAAVRDALAGD